MAERATASSRLCVPGLGAGGRCRWAAALGTPPVRRHAQLPSRAAFPPPATLGPAAPAWADGTTQLEKIVLGMTVKAGSDSEGSEGTVRPPARPPAPQIYPDGQMTQLLDKLEIGDAVMFKGPKGRFSYTANMKRAIGGQGGRGQEGGGAGPRRARAEAAAALFCGCLGCRGRPVVCSCAPAQRLAGRRFHAPTHPCQTELFAGCEAQSCLLEHEAAER